MLPVHPGGITKQGYDIEDEPHLPHIIRREEPRAGEGVPVKARLGQRHTATWSYWEPATRSLSRLGERFRGFPLGLVVVALALGGVVSAFVTSAMAFRVHEDD